MAADITDLKTLKAALPHLLPDRNNAKTTVSSTFLIFQPPGQDIHFDREVAGFFEEARRLFDLYGFADARLHQIFGKTDSAYDREVHHHVARGNHGLIITPRGANEPWRRKIAFAARGKITIYIGVNVRMERVLVPVDLSISTLLSFMFLKQTFMEKEGLDIHFVHVQSDPDRSIEQKWQRMKNLVDLDPHIPLRLIEKKGTVAESLLALIAAERFDTIMMGRRGISRIKRLLLGSVSTAILRDAAACSLFLID